MSAEAGEATLSGVSGLSGISGLSSVSGAFAIHGIMPALGQHGPLKVVRDEPSRPASVHVGTAPVAALFVPRADGAQSMPAMATGPAATGPIITREGQIARALERASADDRFGDHVRQGDAARDRGDWVAAERGYAAALALHPLHWGYCIQRAHMAKEQGHFPRAEAWYRSAVALDAPADMVDQHLDFAARRNAAAFVRKQPPSLCVPPLHAPPTLYDIAVLSRLARVSCPTDCETTRDLALTLLRMAPDNRAVLRRLIALPEFACSNRTFLEIIRG